MTCAPMTGSRACVKLARYGCDCYAYCMLAAGHIDLVIETGLKPYDIVALIPIIEGAGGIVTSWDGGSAAQGGRIIAAGDRRVHAAAIELLEPLIRPARRFDRRSRSGVPGMKASKAAQNCSRIASRSIRISCRLPG